jgi:alpha-mannosidase
MIVNTDSEYPPSLQDCRLISSATEGNVMRLSLLRSPTEPDPKADQGTQEMSWAIYPHTGTLVESDVPQVAYAFNAPMKRELHQSEFAKI